MEKQQYPSISFFGKESFTPVLFSDDTLMVSLSTLTYEIKSICLSVLLSMNVELLHEVKVRIDRIIKNVFII